jgi:hypothetical protein
LQISSRRCQSPHRRRAGQRSSVFAAAERAGTCGAGSESTQPGHRPPEPRPGQPTTPRRGPGPASSRARSRSASSRAGSCCRAGGRSTSPPVSANGRARCVKGGTQGPTAETRIGLASNRQSHPSKRNCPGPAISQPDLKAGTVGHVRDRDQGLGVGVNDVEQHRRRRTDSARQPSRRTRDNE